MVALLRGGLGFDALSGSFLGTAGLVALLGTAVGSATMALVRRLGPALGTPVASVLLLTFGNSSSGGTMPSQYLLAWLSPLSEVLPVGAAVRAIQGLARFDNDGLVEGVMVLTTWTAVCAGLIRWFHQREQRRNFVAPQIRPHAAGAIKWEDVHSPG
ncbi:hypothetical protein ACFT8P_13410 [Streptomyces sp. NPDC057101]|uniref:hypothetical protein n=1 Tax=Streptomyces sp. NPDC057101 TaxID=3346020 RepID=UPI00362C4D8F